MQDSSPWTPLAVLVIDDQAAVREGIASLIGCAPVALRSVRTVANSADALHIADWLRPQIVVLDADLDGEDGLALLPLLSPAKVLVLSCHGDAATRGRAMRLGASEFIEKHQPATDLLAAFMRLATPDSRG